MEGTEVVCAEHQYRRIVFMFVGLFSGSWVKLYSELFPESSLHLSISLVGRCPWSVRARALFNMQGLCGTSVHLYAVLFLSDKIRMRLATCIICNWNHPLMVSALPLAAHNGPFLRFSASCSALWWWRNGDSGCHLGRNKKNDGTFHLLVRKLAMPAHDMVRIQSACASRGR